MAKGCTNEEAAQILCYIDDESENENEDEETEGSASHQESQAETQLQQPPVIRQEQKDISAKKIRAYKAILKSLLLQDKVHENIQDEVKTRYSEKINYLSMN